MIYPNAGPTAARISEMARKRDIERYGDPAARRRAYIPMSMEEFLRCLQDGTFVLPVRTKLLGIESSGDGWRLVVESPDIAEDAGEAKIESSMHFVSRDAVAQRLNIIEYVVATQWSGKPDTANAKPACLDSSRPGKWAAMCATESSGDSAALVALKEAAKVLTWPKPDQTWAEIANVLPETAARKLLGVMLDSFWGPRKPAVGIA